MVQERGSCIFTLALYRNYDFAPVFFLLCEFTPLFFKRSTTLPLFRRPPLTVLHFIQKDRNAHVILRLFVMPVCDFAPDLGIRHLYLIKYIWPNLQLFQFRFNIKKIFKILTVP